MTDTDNNAPPPMQYAPGATDDELRIIETVIMVLRHLPEYRWLAVLDYLRERSVSEGVPPDAGTHSPHFVLAHTPHASIAQVIAESDGHDWDQMDAIAQSSYYRRAADVARWAATQ